MIGSSIRHATAPFFFFFTVFVCVFFTIRKINLKREILCLGLDDLPECLITDTRVDKALLWMRWPHLLKSVSSKMIWKVIHRLANPAPMRIQMVICCRGDTGNSTDLVNQNGHWHHRQMSMPLTCHARSWHSHFLHWKTTEFVIWDQNFAQHFRNVHDF